MRYETAGDQYVGRVACELQLCYPKFTALPPQFLYNNDADRYVVEKLTKTFAISSELYS